MRKIHQLTGSRVAQSRLVTLVTTIYNMGHSIGDSIIADLLGLFTQ